MLASIASIITTSLIEAVTAADFSDERVVLRLLFIVLSIGVGTLSLVIGVLITTIGHLYYRSAQSAKERQQEHEQTYDALSMFRSVALAIKGCSIKGCTLSNIEIPDMDEIFNRKKKTWEPSH